MTNPIVTINFKDGSVLCFDLRDLSRTVCLMGVVSRDALPSGLYFKAGGSIPLEPADVQKVTQLWLDYNKPMPQGTVFTKPVAEDVK